MVRSHVYLTISHGAALILLSATVARASEISLTLSPNAYVVPAGGEITLRGFFTTAASDTFTYSQDYLFGLNSGAPHLDVVAGSVIFSQDFIPPIGGTYFEDSFAGGGYLGPDTVVGPATTAVSDLRTFLVPANVPPGTYLYSYGVGFTTPSDGSSLFDQSLRITVATVEPSTFLLIAFGLGGIFAQLHRAGLRTTA